MSLVLIIGAGQLGSRYIQGLVGCKSNLQITVVDPSSKSLEIAKLRWFEAGGQKSNHHVRWLGSLPSEINKVDLALVVTTSKDRAKIIEKISRVIEVRYWVLEKVLAQSVKELELIRSSLRGCGGAWVNTPRRMMAWHQSLKATFASNGPLTVSFSGEEIDEGLWGIASNSIHFIDLVAWWSGETLLSVDTTSLDHSWHESKRKGFFETKGELIAHFSVGSSLRLSSKEGQALPIQVNLDSGILWNIDEFTGTAKSSTGERVDGRIQFQSQLSGRLVDDIILRGKCDLPSFDESSAMYAIFLDAMLGHWNRSQNRNDDLVPIT